MRCCALLQLSRSPLRADVPLPDAHTGRASFIVRGYGAPRTDHREVAPGGEKPAVVTTVEGPSRRRLWDHTTDVTFTSDVYFQGEGLGDYRLCFRVHPSWSTAAVEVLLFAPYADGVDAGARAEIAAAQTDREAAAAAEDVATAEAVTSRLRADLRRLVVEQEYLRGRQARHAETLRSNDARAVAWSGVEWAVLLCLSLLQMLLFRRAFRNY